MAIESPKGERQVVSVSRGRVTAWNSGVPRDIGALRSGMTTPDAILDERLAPLEREESKLQQEQRTLNATKSRQAASPRRLSNINARLKEIAEEKATIEHDHLSENLPDRTWRDKDGNQWKFTQATTKEIERQTPIEYYKNAAASTVTSWLELRKAERANDFIEGLKSDPSFSSIAVKPKNPGLIPDGWQSTQLPQFSGYYFEPHTAEVLDRYAKDISRADPNVFEKINSFLTTSIFLNPVAHIPNLTANWALEKGIRGVDPRNWGPEFKAALKAFNAVAHQNKDFLAALDAGAPLQSQKRDVQQFSKLLIQRLQDEAEQPGVATKLAEALGHAVNVPAAVKWIVDVLSNKVTWPVHDFYFLQSAFTKAAQQGIPLEEALHDTAEYIPNERLPTRVFNQKWIADTLRSPALMFTRYHYGVLKAWGNILLNFTGTKFEDVGTNDKGEPVNRAGRTQGQESRRALSVAAGLALMSAVIFPEIDKLLKEATGNKDARFRRPGLIAASDAASRAIKGDITPLQAARTVVTPSVAAETVADLAANRDVIGTGRKIYDPTAQGKEIAKEVGRRLEESLSPAQLAMRASESHESMKRTLLSLVGVSFPRSGALRLAAELRAEHLPDKAQTPEDRRKSTLRTQARYLLWQGDKSGLEAARESGLFSNRDLLHLKLEGKMDPLTYEAKGLSSEDLAKLINFRGTTPEEAAKLTKMLERKGASIAKAPPSKRAEMRARWQDALDKVKR